MDDTVKYLIHANVTADGVVERSDVVGAIFGQTEGLLGDELDLRGLQQSSKVGRIDVDIDSENGQSFGHITIETSLDKVATATLGAALESISRVGPCRASVEVTRIEDVRAAKRREVVERAKELLMEGFSDSVTSSDEILSEVREQVRVENITEFEGLPAGPNVANSDAVVVVEGRADVLKLLQYGIKNAIAVEGTNVPNPVAELTLKRTVTVFLDGDRGGELILEELSQVGEIDYVAFAPPGQSVEDLSRGDVFEALQEKVPYEAVAGSETPKTAATDGSTSPAPDATTSRGSSDPSTGHDFADSPSSLESGSDSHGSTDGTVADASTDVGSPADRAPDPVDPSPDGTIGTTEDGDTESAGPDAGGHATDQGTPTTDAAKAETAPGTLRGHVRAVVEEDTGVIRLLDGNFEQLTQASVDEAVDLVAEATPAPVAVVIDGTLTQKLLDVSAQRGVEQIVAREFGEFTKRPTDVRIRTADQLTAS